MRNTYIIDAGTEKSIKLVQTGKYIDSGTARILHDTCIMDELFLDPFDVTVSPPKKPITYGPITYGPQRKGKRGKLSKW